MSGVNADTGKELDGFEHVQQSLGVIFSTRQGERVLREWFGNPGLKLLGQNATPQTFLVWLNTLWMLTALFEPRFRITKFAVDSVDRLGFADIGLDGEHRPYAHLDWTQARAFVSISDGRVTLESAA